MALNRSSITFETIAVYIPDRIPRLTLNGQYLKGRVTLTTITQSSMKAAMTFDQLMCIDDTSYKLPPSKPDSVSIVHTPLDPSLNEIETYSEFQTAKQNSTADYDTTTSGPSNNDIRHRITMYSVEQRTSAQDIAKGDNIKVVCTGYVGKPAAKHVFEMYLNGKIVPMQYTVTSTSISDMSENCSYYRTSNITFQMTAKDNNAVIRCIVNSSIEEPDLYVDTEPIQVYCKYILMQ
ncbi:unnamed protein product [Mytilus edulis]|uniref:Uncharacterized protein n=1 Tax=Mytilus edulis TaxID=6550 RepID=A0A8S3VR69_MYTED|nr:unnamed protein product [Mytilus edulis]